MGREDDEKDEGGPRSSEWMQASGIILSISNSPSLKPYPEIGLSDLNSFLTSCSREGCWNEHGDKDNLRLWERHLGRASIPRPLRRTSFALPLGRTEAWENFSSALLPLWTRGSLDALHIISSVWAHPLPLSSLFPMQPPTLHLEAINLPRVPACSSFP